MNDQNKNTESYVTNTEHTGGTTVIQRLKHQLGLSLCGSAFLPQSWVGLDQTQEILTLPDASTEKQRLALCFNELEEAEKKMETTAANSEKIVRLKVGPRR